MKVVPYMLSSILASHPNTHSLRYLKSLTLKVYQCTEDSVIKLHAPSNNPTTPLTSCPLGRCGWSWICQNHKVVWGNVRQGQCPARPQLALVRRHAPLKSLPLHSCHGPSRCANTWWEQTHSDQTLFCPGASHLQVTKTVLMITCTANITYTSVYNFSFARPTNLSLLYIIFGLFVAVDTQNFFQVLNVNPTQ